jgi:RNA polymerase sigma factor for flagellar operon FliA
MDRPPLSSSIDRAQLAERHLDLVRRVAATIHVRCQRHVELDELVALGNVGLAEAAARYDATIGVPFRAFAYYRVQGAIIDGLRRLTTLPAATWRRIVALRAASEHLERCAQDPEASDTAEALVALRLALGTVRTVYLTSLATLAERDMPAVEPDLPAAIDHARLTSGMPAALAALPEREQHLMRKHYWEGKTLLAAGAELGISRSVACRIHARAVARLRRWYGAPVASGVP